MQICEILSPVFRLGTIRKNARDIRKTRNNFFIVSPNDALVSLAPPVRDPGPGRGAITPGRIADCELFRLDFRPGSVPGKRVDFPPGAATLEERCGAKAPDSHCVSNYEKYLKAPRRG